MPRRAERPQLDDSQDFNGLIFEFHGVPGNWYELLGCKLPDMSLKTQVGRSGVRWLCEASLARQHKRAPTKFGTAVAPAAASQEN